MLARAEELLRCLASGEETSVSKLAPEFEFTKPRVTQLTELLGLHREIRTYINQLPPEAPERFVT